MNSFSPVSKLEVWRKFEDGSRKHAGTLAQNSQAVFFQHSESYLHSGCSLSPFKLSLNRDLQQAPRTPHAGLHGVFADALPDGWGMLLMDRTFRQAGISPNQISPMDRLAFINNRAMGALEFEPCSNIETKENNSSVKLSDLGASAQAIFEGHTDDVLAALVRAGSSGGARPKAQLFLSDENDRCSTYPQSGLAPYLVKFTSQQLPLAHEEGLCEAAYLQLAKTAGIDTAKWKIIRTSINNGEPRQWLAMERFDCTKNNGRKHMHSACGLLGADFRQPSLDYEDLIKASSMLCNSPAAGQQQFRRAIFNLFALNQDDHSKNWSFLQNDSGKWQLSPLYDATYSPTPYGEHSTAFSGYGKNPPIKTLQKLANIANYSNWNEAKTMAEEVIHALSKWNEVARDLGVSKKTIARIDKHLQTARSDYAEFK